MNITNAAEVGGSVMGGGLVTGIAAYFTITRQFKGYIRDAIGKVPEVAATVTQKMRMATFDELTQLRKEFEDHKLEQLRRETEFRRETNERLKSIDDDVRDVPIQVVALLRETKGLIT